MQVEVSEMETFPVLIGDEVTHFHDVSGGYNTDNRFNVVNLIHEVQGPGSPYMVNTDELAHRFEAHLADNFYNFEVDAIRQDGDYPDENYVLSLKVARAMSGEQSFSDAMAKEIDKRERSERL